MTSLISYLVRDRIKPSIRGWIWRKIFMARIARFYIQDTRTYCGNSVMWWCKGGEGYTSNLDEAEVVFESWKGRDTDKLWPCAEIDARATRQFDMQRMVAGAIGPHYLSPLMLAFLLPIDELIDAIKELRPKDVELEGQESHK